MVDTQYLIPAVVRQESGGNPNALSPKGAAGIMQIMPDTARNPGFGVTPLQGWDGRDPRTASVQEQMRFGSEYLNALNRHFGGDTRLALAAYNAGPGAVAQHGGVPPYKETQNYVNNIVGGTPVAASDWRTRATPATDNTGTSDWRSRATPENTQSNWKTRAEPVKEIQPAGIDTGSVGAALQGFNSAVPFGNRISAGLGAGLTTVADKLLGVPDNGLAANYKDIRNSQKTTEENNPLAYLGGAVGGIANSVALAVPKAIGGAAATTGVRGAVNEIPQALSAVGNWVRGSKVAEGASTAAKAGNLVGQAARSAAVAAPTSALYSYGASNNDLNSPEAAADAASGAKLGAAVGAAVPVVSAAASKVIPKVSEEVASLAQVAKQKFGIDLSLDQLSPTNFRTTLQKVSQAIPGSGVDKFQETQRNQWMRAVAQQIGENTDNLGPETIKSYLSRAGTEFDTALSGKTFNVTQKDLSGIQDIATNATRKVTKDVATVVKNNVDDFVKNLESFKVGQQRTIPGERLASLRSQLIKDLPSIDSQAREHVGDIIDKIDDIIARHLSPEEVQKLATARLQWRNFRTLEPLLEKSTDGTVNPTQLMQRVASSKFIKASRKSLGEDNLVDLARIGKQFLGVKGGSDTYPKFVTGGGLGAIGTTAYYAPASVPALLAAGGTGIAANRGYQSLINQSPRLVKAAIEKSANALPSAVPVADMLAAESIPSITIHPRRNK